MALRFHPHPGTIVICDYSGFVPPEMTKRRPAIVVSPRFRLRAGLCTVVPLSTSKPQNGADYHCELSFDPPLPPPYDQPRAWVKADLMAAVAFRASAFHSWASIGRGSAVTTSACFPPPISAACRPAC